MDVLLDAKRKTVICNNLAADGIPVKQQEQRNIIFWPVPQNIQKTNALIFV
jgi:hypothetical protein